MSEAGAASPIDVKPRSRATGVALAIVSAISFSTLGIFAKLVYSQGMAPMQALAWRFTIAAAVLWVSLARSGGWRRPAKDYRDTLLLSVLGFTPQAGLYFVAVRYLDPGLASLLLYLYPAFVVILSFLFYGRRPRAAQVAALVASSLGCALTLWTRGVHPAIGYAIGLVVAVSYAGYLVLGERVISRLDPAFTTANLMGTSAIIYWIITIATGTVLVPTTFASIAGVVGIAVIGSILPIMTLFAAIRIIGSSDASLISTIEPLFTVVLSALFFGDRLTGLQLAGGAFILTGVLMLNIKRKKSLA